jgi:hypothetical protein
VGKSAGQAADHHVGALDAALVQHVAQVYGVALDHLRPRVTVAQALGEEWIDLDGQVAAAPAEPALDLGGERSGAGTQFHHDGLAAFRHGGADRLGQVP